MTTFDAFIKELEAEAEAEGPDAVAEFRALDYHYSVGAELLLRRRELGLSQIELAERSGVSQADISKIERGRLNATSQKLSKLMRALGGTRIRVDWAPAPAGSWSKVRAAAASELAQSKGQGAGRRDKTVVASKPKRASGRRQLAVATAARSTSATAKAATRETTKSKKQPKKSQARAARSKNSAGR